MGLAGLTTGAILAVLVAISLATVAQAQGGVCGDGIAGPGEQCDDGNTSSEDCCADCRPINEGASCQDTNKCPSAGTCSAGVCEAGGDACTDDDIPCTQKVCDQDLGCVQVPDDNLCDDGAACNGVETCDPSAGCTEASEPLDCSYLDSECRTGVCSEAAGGCTAADSENPACDADGDGLLADEDPCWLTLAGDTPITAGCGAADLVRDPAVLLDPVSGRWQDASGPLMGESDLDSLAAAFERRITGLWKAALKVRDGKICKASQSFEKALSRLHKAGDDLRNGMEQLATQLHIDEADALDGADPPGDATPADVYEGSLRMYEGWLTESLDLADDAGEAVRLLCAAVLAVEQIEGTVVSVDDATRIAALADGTSVLVPPRHIVGHLVPGALVKVKGTRAGAGSLFIAEKISAHIDIAPDTGLLQREPTWAECLIPSIVPTQQLPPFASSVIVHRLDGYLQGQQFLFERGMQFAVDTSACPTEAGEGFTYRYNIQVSATYADQATGKLKKNEILAPELTHGELGVYFPNAVTGPFEFTVTKRRLICETANPNQCLLAGEPSSTTYSAWLADYGTYCTAVYSKTAFGLEDVTHSGDTVFLFQTELVLRDLAEVTSVALPSYLQLDNAQFRAEGYRGGLLGSSYPNAETLTLNETFVVLRDSDFYKLYPGEFTPLASFFNFALTGVQRRAGLKWPRVEGTRQGSPARYACTTPALTLDRLQYGCSQSQREKSVETYYRLPFRPTYWSLAPYTGKFWGCGAGNADDPGGSHHAGDQTFAYDLGGPEELEIRAARGGVVVLLDTDETGNAWQCWADLGACVAACNNNRRCENACWNTFKCSRGNYIALLHDDETIGVYRHLFPNSVPAELKPGVRVRRGEVIAKLGNTGRSKGPHLHFQVNKCQEIFDPSSPSLCEGTVANSVESYFEAGQSNPNIIGILDRCYLPTKANPQKQSNNCSDPVGDRPCVPE
jgi:murein DD-endopeptidase MepM/ murein hydrolase activator NlpD